MGRVKKTVTQFPPHIAKGDTKDTWERSLLYLSTENKCLVEQKNKIKFFPVLKASKWIFQRFKKKENISFVPKIYIDSKRFSKALSKQPIN